MAKYHAVEFKELGEEDMPEGVPEFSQVILLESSLKWRFPFRIKQCWRHVTTDISAKKVGRAYYERVKIPLTTFKTNPNDENLSYFPPFEILPMDTGWILQLFPLSPEKQKEFQQGFLEAIIEEKKN